MTTSPPAVRVEDLRIAYRGRSGPVPAVRGVSFTIEPGESYGLVGESGSGKTTAAMALTRYLPEGAAVGAGALEVGGVRVLELDRAALRAFRASGLAVVYQEPGLALNPTLTVGAQVAEVHRLHGATAVEARRRTAESFDRVRLPDPAAIGRRYPHELSGGQQQRVVIAMALAARPALLVLDEPTTGLDSRVEAEIMTLLDRLRGELGFASILISHNLPLVAAHCTRVGVLQRGVLVEEGAATDVLLAPQHPHTRALVAAQPDLAAAGRDATDPADRADRPLLEVDGLVKRYGPRLALDEVTLAVGRGEVLGVVGESGSGKTTLGRVVAGLVQADGGTVRVDADGLGVPPVQVVFQNPDASLNPRRTVRRVLARSIRLLGGDRTAEQLAADAGIDADLLDKLPHELSGGQKQRVAIARAFAGRAPLVVCDEPTSALDVSVQQRILDLLEELQARTGVSLLFISHDLAVVRRLSHRIAVLHEGRLVELAPAEQIFERPQHPYTASLVAAATALRARSA